MVQNHEELKLLNPNMLIAVRTAENAMPAVTTELDWTKQDVLRFMLQSNWFETSVQEQAARDFLAFPEDALEEARWALPGHDPARPPDLVLLEQQQPESSSSQQVSTKDTHHPALQPYYQLLAERNKAWETIPEDLYTRGENALLMCQRVDLWCASAPEVERAVQHLYKLGRHLNQDRETEMPAFLKEFVPGVDPLEF